jgi:Cu-Zn family superoxide dismutase
MNVWKLGLLPVAAAALCACAQTNTAPAGTPPRAAAGAIVKFMTAKGEPAGQAVLTQVPDGVQIVLNVEKLTPGTHGFHIHANGKCAPGPDPAGKTVDFGAAGGHFDPEATGRHGHPEHDAVRHAGDAPNLSADAQGMATLRYNSPKITLVPGKTSVMGKALVVHADADDYKTNPAGNSGGRVLCGIIEPARMDAVVGQAAAHAGPAGHAAPATAR